MWTDLYKPEEVNTVLGALAVGWAIIKWLSPLFAGMLCFYVYRKTENKLKDRINIHKQYKMFKKQQKQKQKEQLKQYKAAIKQNGKLRKQYKDINVYQLSGYEEPTDKSMYSSLSLEFGKDGKVK